jgi:tRNA A37 threonylcarbamoyladenosine biosynthesis protein TsaE
MTYERLFQLKFREEVPTYKLGKKFPNERRKISHIALLQLSNSQLKKVMKNEEEFRKLMLLKEWLLKKEGRENK